MGICILEGYVCVIIRLVKFVLVSEISIKKEKSIRNHKTG
jgi:hypothetical protein